MNRRGQRPDRADVLRRLGAVALISLVGAVVAAVAAPQDALQGQWQRLMYVHVPSAWTAFLCFAVVLAASVAYLRTGRAHWDRCAQAAAEVGVGATALTLVTGGIWGQAVWGTWWTWDPRLVSTAVLGALYLGYLGVRELGREPLRSRRAAAWVGVVSFCWVPVVHFSVVWWRTLHQPPTILGPPTQVPPIDPRMAVALALSVVAATSIALWLLTARITSLASDAPVAERTPSPGEPVPALRERVEVARGRR